MRFSQPELDPGVIAIARIDVADRLQEILTALSNEVTPSTTSEKYSFSGAGLHSSLWLPLQVNEVLAENETLELENVEFSSQQYAQSGRPDIAISYTVGFPLNDFKQRYVYVRSGQASADSDYELHISRGQSPKSQHYTTSPQMVNRAIFGLSLSKEQRADYERRELDALPKATDIPDPQETHFHPLITQLLLHKAGIEGCSYSQESAYSFQDAEGEKGIELRKISTKASTTNSLRIFPLDDVAHSQVDLNADSIDIDGAPSPATHAISGDIHKHSYSMDTLPNNLAALSYIEAVLKSVERCIGKRPPHTIYKTASQMRYLLRNQIHPDDFTSDNASLDNQRLHDQKFRDIVRRFIEE